jgi:hypothetical protein
MESVGMVRFTIEDELLGRNCVWFGIGNGSIMLAL